MTNRYIDFNDEETMKFLNQMLANQKLTMPTKSSIFFRETETYSKTLFVDYQKKSTKIKTINNYAKKYNAIVDVSSGYGYIIEKLLQQFDSKNVLFPALKGIFEKVTQRTKIDITDIELEYGELPEDILLLIDDYNNSLNIDISAALDEHTKSVQEENAHLKNEKQKHIEELEMLRRELLEAKSMVETLSQENSEYKLREEETVSAMKRIYHL